MKRKCYMNWCINIAIYGSVFGCSTKMIFEADSLKFPIQKHQPVYCLFRRAWQWDKKHTQSQAQSKPKLKNLVDFYCILIGLWCLFTMYISPHSFFSIEFYIVRFDMYIKATLETWYAEFCGKCRLDWIMKIVVGGVNVRTKFNQSLFQNHLSHLAEDKALCYSVFEDWLILIFR